MTFGDYADTITPQFNNPAELEEGKGFLSRLITLLPVYGIANAECLEVSLSRITAILALEIA
jgi:hypothetical protein